MALNFQLYATKRIPRLFKIEPDNDGICNPYDSPEIRRKIKEMGIVFWRDENHARPIVLEVGLDGTYMFYCQGIMNEVDWEIDEYLPEALEMPEDEFDPDIARIANVGKRKDMYAWIVFNHMRLIARITERSIKIAV